MGGFENHGGDNNDSYDNMFDDNHCEQEENDFEEITTEKEVNEDNEFVLREVVEDEDGEEEEEDKEEEIEYEEDETEDDAQTLVTYYSFREQQPAVKLDDRGGTYFENFNTVVDLTSEFC